MKKKGLALWTVLTIASVLLLVLTFLFSSITECVGLYTKDASEITWLSFANFFAPFVYGFNAIANFSVRYLTISLIVAVGLFLIGTVVLFVLMGVKKKWKYLGQFFVLLITAVVGVYLLCFIFDTDAFNGMSPFRQMITTNTFYNSLLLFTSNGKIPGNVITSTIYYLFLVFIVTTIVAVFGMTILTVIRLLQTRVETNNAAPVKDETVSNAKVNVTEEEKPLEKPTPKKKVVLVVKRYDSFKDAGEKPAEKPTNYPHEQVVVEPLTREDIRRALKEELDARSKEEQKISSYNEMNKLKEEHLTVSEADATKVEKDEPQIPTPVIVAIPTPVKEKDLNEESTKVEPKVEKEPSLTKEQIRDIIKEELSKALEELKNQEPEVVEEVVEEVHEIKVPVVKKVVEETKTETEPNNELVTEEVKEEPVESKEELTEESSTTKPVEEQKATDDKEEPVEELEVNKIERIPFAQRIREADAETKDNYNQIKSLLLSYGLKNRTSNGGDAFRLHKVTYCKITVAGKSLKLYLALNPEDYKNTTLPIKDASSKAIYKEIPLVFKVKSGLSLRRAEQLITEMMDKHGIEQADRVEVKDYASTLENTTDEEDSEE